MVFPMVESLCNGSNATTGDLSQHCGWLWSLQECPCPRRLRPGQWAYVHGTTDRRHDPVLESAGSKRRPGGASDIDARAWRQVASIWVRIECESLTFEAYAYDSGDFRQSKMTPPKPVRIISR